MAFDARAALDAPILPREVARPLKLTARGRHAVAFGTMTPPRWWNALVKEIDAMNDQDEELGLAMLDERIAGMQALRTGWYRIINNDEHWQVFQ